MRHLIFGMAIGGALYGMINDSEFIPYVCACLVMSFIEAKDNAYSQST